MEVSQFSLLTSISLLLLQKMQKAINTNIHKEICQRAGADHVQLAVVGKTESKKKN